MKQFGALLKSKGIGVPFIVAGVDLAKPDSDASLITTGFIKADQIMLAEGPIQGLEWNTITPAKWDTIADVKPPLPDPHDIPIELALNALQNHGLGIKEVTWNHGWDQWPTVTLEIAVHGSADQIKQTMTALQGWVITKGKY
ncbi:hypothetical protein KXR64_16605 [Brucella intermedia]|uniref:hypothetical protein n=1 Tax=Brucella TaxID=234 RepID=UPI0009462B00|nr:hypothetical protein [Brucella intermedia]